MSSIRPARSARLSLEALEDRTTPTYLARPGNQAIAVNGTTPPLGGASVAVGDIFPEPDLLGRVFNEYVTGTGPGVEGLVRIWNLSGTLVGSFVPFPGFTGGINVAVGDVIGDGSMEIIAAVAGNGPPHVKVFTNTGQLLSSFLAFDARFFGGVNVATGNVLGGIAGGGFAGGTVSSSFKQEIIIGAAAGISPHVVVTDGVGTQLRSFLTFDLGYRGGVTVAAGNIDTTRSSGFSVSGSDPNSYDEIVVGAATDVPHVKVFDVFTGAIQERLSFLAFDRSIRGGVTVAAGSTDGNPGAEIYVSQIRQGGGVPVRVFDGNAQLRLQFSPFPATYTTVVNMAIANIDSGFLFANRFEVSFQERYDPEDDDSFLFNFFLDNNPDFLRQDLAVVTGDGPYSQRPRLLLGPSIFSGPNLAGGNGPGPT